ncbi:MAG TPA: helix-turn-helix domain-containing protein [Kribbellaceae bacterium]|nr:helix-turn-helix domain-containing protein [Kribbellaceae bacterium]
MDGKTASAGELLRAARLRAGLSQQELAERAGIMQSVVSAYERGHRQPSVPTLAALIDATGHDLVMSARRKPRGLQRLSGPVGRRLRRNRDKVLSTATKHGVTNLRVFGSVARGEDRPDSDLDLLIDLPPGIGLLGLGRVRSDIERIVGTHVDLVPETDLKPDVRARVLKEVISL